MTPDLFGREGAIRAAEAHLAQHGRLALVGVAGVGKTRLALELMRRHGGVWVNAGACSTADALSAAIHAGVRAAGEQPPKTMLAWARGRGVTTLFLDNIDDVPEAALAWMEAARDLVSVVATTRRSTGTAFDLPLPPLDRASASAMFRGRIPASAASRIGPGEDAAIERIADALAGLPLAITLAAARLSMMSADELADELSVEVLRDPSAGHVAVGASIDATLRRVGADARKGLSAAAVFGGSVHEDPFAAILGTSAGAAREMLAHLCHHHLIEADLAAPGRFRLHPLVKSHARERTPPAEMAELILRHAAYYAPIAQQTGVEGHMAFSAERDAWVRAERDELAVLVARAEQGQVDADVAAHASLANLHHSTPDPALFLRALAVAERRGSARVRAEMLLAAGLQLSEPGNLDRCASRCDASAAFFVECGDPDSALYARARAAVFRLMRRRDPTDEAILDEACEHVKQPRQRFRLYKLRPQVLRDRPIEAVLADKRAYLAWAETAGSPDAVVDASRSLAVSEITAGNLASALALCDRTINAGTPIGQHSNGFMRATRGLVHHVLGNLPEAHTDYEIAVEHLKQFGEGPGSVPPRVGLALVRIEQGEVVDLQPEEVRELLPIWFDFAFLIAVAASASALNARRPLAPRWERLPIATPIFPTVDAWEACADALAAAQHAAAHRQPIEPELARVRSVLASWPPPGRAVMPIVERITRRLLERAEADAHAWFVARDGTRFAAPGAPFVDLSSRKPIARALARLAQGPCTRDELADAAWPGERIEETSRRNRIGVLLATLRKAGLTALATTDAGLALSGPVIVVPS